ncbi:thiamine-phosphate diphosphorylase [Roseivivax lentus]|uniref:Thiamine-phosphate synthase n=1 Tax=Roseivivax lentus TaxID=633194 RepID=A0A1N7NQG7_9RHOB|nr:thiamine phosphate synthase [Roseivivax lentus]SIT00532.1 thiamine-phosphate diphosphorylase [Roseivivax lentus]
MALTAQQLRLYLVTDPGLCPGAALVRTVTAAVRGGVGFVQLRDKTASTGARVEAARALKQALAGSGVPIVLNDDVEAAIAADVDGVHIGQQDISPAEARARLGPGRIVGLSCETEAQVTAVDPGLVDYLGLGTVFPTATKSDHTAAIGLAGLARLARASSLPSVAIGGLRAEHAAAVRAAGCDGIAVVSAICGQPDPEEAARLLRRALATEKRETE